MKSKQFKTFFKEKLTNLEEKNLLRKTQVYDKSQYIDFSSNDYLGLGQRVFAAADHYTKEVQDFIYDNQSKDEVEEFLQTCLWDEAKKKEIEFYPITVGSSASRLVTGTHKAHEDLEKYLAEWKKTEAALSFGSGYLTNLGSLSALLGPKDIVFSDELNHACILDGIRLSGAKKFFYRHNNIKDLEELLKKYRDNYEKALVVTDTVFSMDGDRAKLKEITQLKNQYNFSIYVDEAHAAGVLGPSGAGLVEELIDKQEIQDGDIEIQMGTFSKAIATEGAYIAGSRDLIEFLKNSARTFIFSTAYSPLIASLTLNNLRLIREQKKLREKLNKNIQFFRQELKKISNIRWTNEETSIFAIQIGNNEETIAASHKLRENKLLVLAIREPSVSFPRLRICLSARHTREELNKLLKFLKLISEETRCLH